MRVVLTLAAIAVVAMILVRHADIPSILPQEIGCREIITDAQDREVLANFCLTLADKIKEDGKLPPEERKISTPFELEDMRKGLADEKLFKLGKKYPKLPECLGAYLDKIPKEDELSEEGRNRWIAAFEAIAKEVAG